MQLAELLRDLDIHVDQETVSKFEYLANELIRWNQRRNLTGINHREEILEKHFVDSLALLPYVNPKSRLLDLGSGAGFPALPLKIACPSLEVVSVESVGKKVDFQQHIRRFLRLSGFTAVHARLESLIKLPEYSKQFDAVTARAVSVLPELFLMAHPFLREQGQLLAMKGPHCEEEIEELRKVLDTHVWSIEKHFVTLPKEKAKRCLVIVKKKT